jgi:hypothetical protein
MENTNVWGKCRDVVHILTTEFHGAKNTPGLEIKRYTTGKNSSTATIGI